MTYLGDERLMTLPKTAFFAPSRVAVSGVMACLDWATAMRDAGRCVIGGFHSRLEREVLHFLLRGRQPVIVVLARQMYRRPPPELAVPLAEGRLLIVSAASGTRASRAACQARNVFVCDAAEEVVFAPFAPDSSLAALHARAQSSGKPCRVLQHM